VEQRLEWNLQLCPLKESREKEGKEGQKEVRDPK
jgi:hypothetical protein